MPPATGFYGKIPSRGDFVRAGLPASFVAAWDAWLQDVLPAARAALGEEWNDCWMEAPVWRFSLPAGQCGPDRVLGLWMPSVDTAGRQFPLTVAMVFANGAVPDDDETQAWLDAAEDAGRAALEADLSPTALTDRLPAAPQLDAPPQDLDGAWWSAGSPFVRPTSFSAAALPDAARFATMLRDPPSAADEAA